MQPNMFPPEPNLIAETYRNHVIQYPRRFEKYYDFIDVNQDGLFLLGTSSMTGRIWSGSIWLFNDPANPPDVEKCVAGMEFDSGVPVGKWFDSGMNIVVGTDSGAIHILSLTSMNDINKQYLSTLAIVCEHDDVVTSVDVSCDSTKILSASMDLNIKIWDIENTLCEKTYECAHAQTVTSARFQFGKSDIFASTSTDGEALIWDAKEDKPASLITKTESGYSCCDWIDDNTIALGTNSGSVFLVDLRTKSEISRNSCSKRPIYNVNYDKGSELLAVCADDPVVRVFKCTCTVLDEIYENEKHKDFIRGLTWKSRNHLYTCGYDSQIIFHEICNEEKGTKEECEMEEKEGETGKEEEKIGNGS